MGAPEQTTCESFYLTPRPVYKPHLEGKSLGALQCRSHQEDLRQEGRTVLLLDLTLDVYMTHLKIKWRAGTSSQRRRNFTPAQIFPPVCDHIYWHKMDTGHKMIEWRLPQDPGLLVSRNDLSKQERIPRGFEDPHSPPIKLQRHVTLQSADTVIIHHDNTGCS